MTPSAAASGSALAVTCGAEGALVYDGEQLLRVSAPSVRAIDTNGAGDMFAGAFLYALSEGHGYQKAGEFANFAAAKVVTQFGPRLRPEQHQALKQQFFS
jgi:sugar/nucleoside kinase (ribokinase family)